MHLFVRQCTSSQINNTSFSRSGPSDFYLLPNIKRWLHEQKFSSNEEVKWETDGYSRGVVKSYYIRDSLQREARASEPSLQRAREGTPPYPTYCYSRYMMRAVSDAIQLYIVKKRMKQ